MKNMPLRTYVAALALAAIYGCNAGPVGSSSGETETGTASSTEGTSNSTTEGTTAGPTTGPAVDRCDEFCTATVDAACEGGPTYDACLLTCQALASDGSCNELGNSYFDCVDNAGVTCDAQGEPVAIGCGLHYLLAIDCAVNSNPNPEIEEPCMVNCGLIADAACPNNGPVEDCVTNCLWFGATGTGCDDEWGTYLECANEANYSCILGFAVAEGCGDPFLAYTNCVDGVGE